MKKLIYTAMTLLATLATGCAPTLEQSNLELPNEYIYNSSFSQDTCSSGMKWWEHFADTTLNAFVDEALLHNRDLRAAAANVEAARSYIWVAKSEFLPSLSLSAEAEAYRINGARSEEYSLTPTLEWEISLFGALRNTKRSAIASFLSKESNYRAMELSLTAQVATSYFTLLQYERSYNIARRSLSLRCDATALVDSLFTYGMSDGIALDQAKSLVYTAQADLYKYKRAMEQTYLSLNVLLGRTPQSSDLSRLGTNLIDDQLPPDIPIGLPSELVERRPDIMESYFTMASAAAKVGVARAERYPSITLTGDGGVVSSTLKDLKDVKPIGWSVVGSISQPLFNFGKLRRNEQMRRHEYTAALNDYEQSILTALSEVESALVEIGTYRYQSRSAASLVVANAKIAHSTTALYVNGMGDYLDVIDAQRELYTSQIEFIAIVTQQYINYINLFKSLGGGW